MSRPLVITITPAVEEGSCSWLLHVGNDPKRTDVGGFDSMLAKAHRIASWQHSTLIVYNRDRSIREAREYVDPRKIAEDGINVRPTMKDGRIMHVPVPLASDSICE